MAEKAKPAPRARGSIAGDNMPADVRAQWKAAERLQAVAERTIEDAQKIHDQPRQMNTARRARLGSGVMEQQQARIAHARTAMRIAEALREGTASPELAKIQSLADVERLQSAYRQAMYQNPAARAAHRGSMTGVEPTKLDIAHAKPVHVVHAHVTKWDMERLAPMLKGKGVERELKRLTAIAAKIEYGWQHSDPRDIEAISKVAKTIKAKIPLPKETWRRENRVARDMHGMANRWLAEVKEYEAVKRLGLHEASSMRRLLDAYSDVRVNRNGADPIKVAERALIGTKIPGFFPTPESLAKRMADLAEVQPGHHVLEPSAGTGRLADVAKAKGAKVDAVEVNSSLRDVLTKKGHSVVATDFTSMQASQKYDRILMNPPFEKGQDIAHVRRAYDMLKPGGKMVAIMGEGAFGRSDKTASGFRAWLDTVGGASEKLPAGTFKESNTGVNTRLVTIEKPLQVAPAAAAPRPAMGHNQSPLDASRQMAVERHAAAVDAYNSAMRRNAYTEIQAREAEMRQAFDDMKKTQVGTGANKPAWARSKLDFSHLRNLTDQELTSIQRQIMEDPASRNPAHLNGRDIRIYNKTARGKLERIAQEISGRLAEKKRAAAALPQPKTIPTAPQSLPPPAAAVAPTRGSRPLSASVSAAVERAMQMQADKMAKPQATTLATKPITPSGKLGIALAVASNAVAIAGIVMSARKAEAAPAPSTSGTTYERTYRAGPKSGTTETVRKPAA